MRPGLTVLDLGDAFAEITVHLTDKDCQSLRRTCKLLRCHAAVVAGITSVDDAGHYQEGLHQLSSLRRLNLENPSSIFHLHHLSALSHLTRVVITNTQFVDLMPLSFIACLRSLHLTKVEHYGSLPSLVQLETVWLSETIATPAVLKLCTLTQLGLCEGSQLAGLDQLQQLECLSATSPAESWSDDDFAALSAAMSTGLPSLHDLSCDNELLPPVPSLMQLTALLLTCNYTSWMPAVTQALLQLTGLVKLGLFDYIEQPPLQSNSVTALFLAISDYCSDASLPCLVSCTKLKHVMLASQADMAINFEQLPPQPITLWVEHDADQPLSWGPVVNAELVVDTKAADRLQVQHVRCMLTWGSNPAKLQAEHT